MVERVRDIDDPDFTVVGNEATLNDDPEIVLRERFINPRGAYVAEGVGGIIVTFSPTIDHAKKQARLHAAMFDTPQWRAALGRPAR